MAKNFTFKKSNNTDWYIILPEWKGDPEDLQMIEGADEWLELLSHHGSIVKLTMSDRVFEGAEQLTLVRLKEENLGGGGIYNLKTYEGKKIDLNIWLCEVTRFVFGRIPSTIYYRVI